MAPIGHPLAPMAIAIGDHWRHLIHSMAILISQSPFRVSGSFDDLMAPMDVAIGANGDCDRHWRHSPNHHWRQWSAHWRHSLLPLAPMAPNAPFTKLNDTFTQIIHMLFSSEIQPKGLSLCVSSLLMHIFIMISRKSGPTDPNSVTNFHSILLMRTKGFAFKSNVNL